MELTSSTRVRSLALLAVLLVACGNENQARRDARTGECNRFPQCLPDADPYQDADPNVRGTVTVKLVDKNDLPLAGFYVVFIDTDGTITERTSDSAGLAQADVYPNASVTAIRSAGMSYALVTVQALNPGDTIKLISAAPTVSSSEDPFTTRTVPIPSADLAIAPTKTGTTATFTTVAPHGFTIYDRAIIANVDLVGYNGSWQVTSAPTPTTFTATVTDPNAPAGTPGVGATATRALAFTVDFAPYPAPYQIYQVRTRCGTTDIGAATSVTLVLPTACASGYIDVLSKDNTGATLAWMHDASVIISGGGFATIAGGWHQPSDRPLSYLNVTPEISELTVAWFAPYGRGAPVAAVTGTSAGNFTLPSVPGPSYAAIISTFTCPEGSSPTCLSTPSGSVAQRYTRVVNGNLPTPSFDIAANLLPWVKADYVPATTTLDITTTGTGSYDIFEANVRYTRGQNSYTWRVFGPFAQSVTFPTLPATAPGDPTILSSDIMSSSQAFIGDSDAFHGYRGAIQSPFEALSTCEASTNVNVKPSTGGTNRISQWN